MTHASDIKNFKILGINHIGLAAKDPQKARNFFTVLLGLQHLGDELVKEQQTLTTMIASTDHTQAVAIPRLEVLENEAGKDGPIAAFLSKRGGGIHHLALAVNDVDTAIAYLIAKGVRMIDSVARNGAHHTRIAFVHPEATGGILVELVEDHG